MTVSEIERKLALLQHDCQSLASLDGIEKGERRAVQAIVSQIANIRHELTAALSDQAGGWQDISTVPKDGTHIDVWFVLRADHAARWPNVYWAAGKYWNGGPTDQGEGSWVATHWRNLPAPPPSSTAGEDKS